MLADDLLGLPIPAAGPVFVIVLAVHVVSALTAVASGAVAALAPKQPGRHPRAGRVYLWSLGCAAGTATVLAVIRWRHDLHLLGLAVAAFLLAWSGFRARRQHRPGWRRRHGIGMGGSYIVLLTAFYVDNGPFLPLWNRLPPVAYWLLPSLVGVPITAWALRRARAERGRVD